MKLQCVICGSFRAQVAGSRPCGLRAQVAKRSYPNMWLRRSMARILSVYRLRSNHVFWSPMKRSGKRAIIWRRSMALSQKSNSKTLSNLGINYNSVGLLSDASLRHWVFPTSACYDVLHGFFPNGLVAVEFGLFLKPLRDNGLELDRLQICSCS